MSHFHTRVLRSLLFPLVATSLTAAELPNPSFETIEGGKPAAWQGHTWAGDARFSLSDIARSGEHSVLVEAGPDGCDSAWLAHASVKPNARYRLTGWIRTAGVEPGGGLGALLNLHGRPERSDPVTGTSDWTQVGFEFDTGWETSVQINCLVGYFGKARGGAWFDDLQLVLLEERQAPIEEIRIDANRRGEPISPYIYGQFIEHMGRCIYGGIWAEMLEDRKFHFPVTEQHQPWDATNEWRLVASPWRMLGPAGSVVMRADKDWADWPIPQLAAGAGIEQPDLALQAEEAYVGRIVLAAVDAAAAGPVRISLVSAGGDEAGSETVTLNVLDGFRRYPLRFRWRHDSAEGVLRILNDGETPIQVAAVSLMPADNVQGFRHDTLQLLRELNSPIYRWPGGNFVSGYEWRDGLGDPDRRPTYANPAWTGIETNDVGMHEFIDLCRLIEAEPMIAVNAGFGDAWSAMQEVQYANGDVDTPMGAWRARNGEAEPFNVRWWCIGNEMYGDWQLGYMSLEDYTRKHNDFARRMRQADPTIKLIAVGAAGEWSQGMLRSCAHAMDAISEHFYVGGDAEKAGDVISHTGRCVDEIRAQAHADRCSREAFPGPADRDIRIAMDEWNYWYGPHIYGELGTRYFLKDALGIAAGLHEYFRQSDIYLMANYAQTVNVIGAIKTTRTDAAFAATGEVLRLYRAHFGVIPLQTTPSEPVDVQAALTQDGRHLTIGVVNPFTETLQLPLRIEGVDLTGRGRRFCLSGPEPMAYNEPGQPSRVTVEESAVTDAETLHLPPLSVTIYRLEVRAQRG